MLNKYAENNARGFIYPGETELPNDYPVYYGYAYVAVFEDGEVRVISSDVQGTALTLKADLQKRWPAKKLTELRRCELVKRMLDTQHLD